MNTTEILHQQAMALSDRAFIMTHRSKLSGFTQALYLRASKLEAEAAASFDGEPTRSVLYRSAAWLAENGKDYERAIMLAEIGLEGTPPPEIAEELIEVRDHSAEHLLEAFLSHAVPGKCYSEEIFYPDDLHFIQKTEANDGKSFCADSESEKTD